MKKKVADEKQKSRMKKKVADQKKKVADEKKKVADEKKSQFPFQGHRSMAMIRMRQKMFGSSGGFGFNVSFVDRASMFVESVFETSLSLAYVL